ncbi:MAG TPA: hypothetical protein VFL34_07470, partial [Candidatus Sulfotelmatobacter sp.]|nr:hypothetical protein [Candidatus Sulfotelmatobacter sp.]
YVRAGMEGREMGSKEGVSQSRARPRGRTVLDWLLIFAASGIFAALALLAKFPQLDIAWNWAGALTLAMIALLTTCGIALWRTTRFR